MSNSNYIVLGVLIEKVSGIKYEEFLQKYIFNPLDMKSSGCLPHSLDLDNVANSRLEQMFTPVLARYGMGWFIQGNKLSHGGDLPGFSTRITRYPDSRLLIIILSNTDGCKESNMSHYADLVEKYVF